MADTGGSGTTGPVALVVALLAVTTLGTGVARMVGMRHGAGPGDARVSEAWRGPVVGEPEALDLPPRNLRLLAGSVLPLPGPGPEPSSTFGRARTLARLEAHPAWFAGLDRGWAQGGVELPDAGGPEVEIVLGLDLVEAGELGPRIETETGRFVAWPEPLPGAPSRGLRLVLWPAAATRLHGRPRRLHGPAAGRLRAWWIGRSEARATPSGDDLEILLARLDTLVRARLRDPAGLDPGEPARIAGEAVERFEAEPTPTSDRARLLRLERTQRLLLLLGGLSEILPEALAMYPGPLGDRVLTAALQRTLRPKGAFDWLEESPVHQTRVKSFARLARSVEPELRPVVAYLEAEAQLASTLPSASPGAVTFPPLGRALEAWERLPPDFFPPPGPLPRLRFLVGLLSAPAYLAGPPLGASLADIDALRARLVEALGRLPADPDRDRTLRLVAAR